jgi:hypothetical protein
MKKIAISFIALAISTLSWGQKVFFDLCNFDKVYIRCEVPPSFGKDNTELQHFFENALGSDTRKVTGQLVIKVVIDSTGKLCCKSAVNSSNYTIDKKKFGDMMQTMPVWSPGKQGGTILNCAELIFVNFKNGKITTEYKMDESTY